MVWKLQLIFVKQKGIPIPTILPPDNNFIRKHTTELSSKKNILPIPCK